MLPSSVSESTESRRKRLHPNVEDAPSSSTAPAPPSSGRGSGPASTIPGAVIPNRKDAPVIGNVRRGSASDATLAGLALQHLGSEALVDELLLDRVARSGVAPVASLLNTWRKFHDLTFQQSSVPAPMIPITVRSLVLTGAMFKKGSYRPYPNYLSDIMAVHVEANRQWCQLLTYTAVLVSRSYLRGIGPVRQSCRVAFAELCALPRHPEPLVKSGPSNPIHVALLSPLFLLREVDASTAKVSSWAFDGDRMELTWVLPASKCDHMPLGVKRSCGCLCGLANFACPYHLAVQHMA